MDSSLVAQCRAARHAFSIEEPHYLENHQRVPDLPAETGETYDAEDWIIDHLSTAHRRPSPFLYHRKHGIDTEKCRMDTVSARWSAGHIPRVP